MSEKDSIESLLVKLKKERAELDITIAKLESVLGIESSDPNSHEEFVPGGALPEVQPPVDNTQKLRSDTFFRMSMPAAAEKYLNMVKRPAETNEIAGALKSGGLLTQAKSFELNVYTGLSRDKRFTRVDKKWGLTEWYPSSPKSAAPKKKKRKKEPVRKSGRSVKKRAVTENQEKD